MPLIPVAEHPDPAPSPGAPANQPEAASSLARRPTMPHRALDTIALLGLVGAPAVASAADLAPGLPPEMGVWGIVAYAIVQLGGQIAAAIASKREADESRKRADKAEADLAALRSEIDRDERSEVARLRRELAALKRPGTTFSPEG